MITLFRRIRQKVIASGSITKYLLYATGEILLVVIGILIALQINNWNEDRKALIQEQQVLRTLSSEFAANLEELKYDIMRMDTLIQKNLNLLNYIGKEEAALPAESTVDSLIIGSFGHITWNPSSFMLNDLKNSGQMTKLSDPNIQQLLFKWERHFENLEEFKEEDKNATDAFLMYLKRNGSLRNIDYAGQQRFDINYERSGLGYSNLKLLSELEFENVVDDKLFVALLMREQYQISVKLIEELLDAIDSITVD